MDKKSLIQVTVKGSIINGIGKRSITISHPLLINFFLSPKLSK